MVCEDLAAINHDGEAAFTAVMDTNGGDISYVFENNNHDHLATRRRHGPRHARRREPPVNGAGYTAVDVVFDRMHPGHRVNADTILPFGGHLAGVCRLCPAALAPSGLASYALAEQAVPGSGRLTQQPSLATALAAISSRGDKTIPHSIVAVSASTPPA